MKRLTTDQLRQAFLDFFVSKGHRLVKSDSLAPTNDPSVLFTSAGMNQFKDLFLGRVKDFRRAASCQKCLRTGDLDEVGRTPFHHTFFEMLGNFSFGDYFKKDAIAWAWEFVTKILEIDPEQLWVSVYEDDDEAEGIWRREIGLSPEKVRRFGAKDNFWPSNAILDGPNGPCGPCSEIYFEREGQGAVEVWNLVFTQFNRCDGGRLEPLPSKNIDTGMGLERMSSVLQGVRSNFDIDIFLGIMEALKRAVPAADPKALHTLADHARAVTFSIGDGILPSNEGRGYVVRKLIRRCQYLAQAQEARPFLYQAVSSVAQAMAGPYPEVLERRDNIAQIVKAEEEKYIRNILEGGSERLQAVIDQLKNSGKAELSPEVALDLYVTYGVQPDFTKERCEKEGVSVDLKKVDVLIVEEQRKSRAGSKIAVDIFTKEAFTLKKSVFIGYETDACRAKILQIVRDGKEVDAVDAPRADYWVVLDQTPFYAESGGQVGDRGVLRTSQSTLEVIDVQKQKDSLVHLCRGLTGAALRAGDEIEAAVDPSWRQAVRRAHTATHVLQAALRQVLGVHVQQAGSFVEPDRFRFDFTHFKDISSQEMERVEELLSEYILRNDALAAEVMDKAQAQKTGALAFFGEKYEDTVRVVSIAGYSKEFCGGTHADATGEIGTILLLGESSVGSGLRRIEAVTGREAFRRIARQSQMVERAAAQMKTSPDRLDEAVGELLERTRGLEKETLQLKEKNLRGDVEDIVRGAKKIGAVSCIIHDFGAFDVGLLRRAADLLKEKVFQSGVFLLVARQESAAFVCAATKDLVQQGVSAGNLLKAALAAAGGSGGGRPDFAQGGIKDVQKVDLVVRAFEAALREVLEKGGGA